MSCSSHRGASTSIIKSEIASFLHSKGDLSEQRYQSFKKSREGFSVRGIHNRENLKRINKDGIYKISASNHSRVHYLLLQDEIIHILSLHNRTDLSLSINKVVRYSIEKGICREVMLGYINRLVNTFYARNKNLETRLDKNCEFKTPPLKSGFSFQEIHSKLAEYLVDINQFESIEYYNKNKYFLGFDKLSYYYGLPRDNEKLDVGTYQFANYGGDQAPIVCLLLLSNKGYKILNASDELSLTDGINKILKFAEDN